MMDQYIGYVAVFSSRAPTIMAGGHSQFFLNCSREAVSTSYFWRRIRSVRSVIAPTTFKIYVIIRPSHCKTAVKILKKVHVETLCRVLVGTISQVRETYCLVREDVSRVESKVRDIFEVQCDRGSVVDF